jgi:hypothetical protein
MLAVVTMMCLVVDFPCWLLGLLFEPDYGLIMVF